MPFQLGSDCGKKRGHNPAHQCVGGFLVHSWLAGGGLWLEGRPKLACKEGLLGNNSTMPNKPPFVELGKSNLALGKLKLGL